MPWRVGIDEAGYGPNLGPMVMASTACRVPDDAPASLWELLNDVIRKKEDGRDRRTIVDDSKKVHSGKDGFAKLERGAFAFLPKNPDTLRAFLQEAAIEPSLEDLLGEAWFVADAAIPQSDGDKIDGIRNAIREACQRVGVEWGPVWTMAVPTPRFNDIVDRWSVKSGVTSTGVTALLRKALDLPGDDPISIAVDRLGGRQYYAPLLGEAFVDGWPRPIKETPEICEYLVYGLSREIRVTFEPKADGTHLNVALASMFAKYLRELFMQQFNAYWIEKVPGTPPTAGYPVDAIRFMNAIRPYLAANGIDERTVWRSR
jgi:hypothetical protein